MNTDAFNHGYNDSKYGFTYISDDVKSYCAGMMQHMSEKFFDEDGYFIFTLPDECIKECSHPGNCEFDVKMWIKKLGFVVPVEKAQEYLKDFGAWDDLETCDYDLLAERVLWIACGDLVENGAWLGLQH